MHSFKPTWVVTAAERAEKVLRDYAIFVINPMRGAYMLGKKKPNYF